MTNAQKNFVYTYEVAGKKIASPRKMNLLRTASMKIGI